MRTLFASRGVGRLEACDTASRRLALHPRRSAGVVACRIAGFQPAFAAHASGAALVLTLAMLVLLSCIIVAFLMSVRTDLASSKSYEASTSARVLADSAVNLVIAQIREGSTQPNQAWISQPGLIRTYDTSGLATKAYKLYSASSMVVAGAFDPAADAASGSGDLPPSATPGTPEHWRSRPAIWTDMNMPITDSTVTPARGIYPIFDANDLKDDGTGKASIMDADGDGKPD